MSSFRDPLTFGSTDEASSLMACLLVFLDNSWSCSHERSTLHSLTHVSVLLQDLEDLTQHLNAALATTEPSAGSFTLGDADPLSHNVDHPVAAQSPDPFDALASTSRQHPDMSYPTYGQLVTPQVVPQQQAQQAATYAADALSPTDDSTAVGGNQHQQQAAEAHGGVAVQQPSGTSSGLTTVPDSLDRLGSIPSPLIPAAAVKDLPLVITVSEPQRKEAAGVLGMKGWPASDATASCCIGHTLVACPAPDRCWHPTCLSDDGWLLKA